MNEGLKPSNINDLGKNETQEEGVTQSIETTKAYQAMINYLTKNNNAEFARLIGALTPSAKQFLVSDLGGSWRDLLGDRVNIDGARESLQEFEEACDQDPKLYVDPVLQVKRKEALKKLKTNIFEE